VGIKLGHGHDDDDGRTGLRSGHLVLSSQPLELVRSLHEE
jgi:hypothetical protein